MYTQVIRIIGLLAAIAAMGASAAESESDSAYRANKCGPSAAVLTVKAKEFQFEPNVLDVEKGQSVCLILENDGVMAHNLRLEGLNLETRTIQPGETDALPFTPSKPGEYHFFCTVPGHREAGMEGNLTVQP